MSHLVIYTGLDGTVGYQPCNTLTEAVNHVEVLRNEKGVDGSKIFKLEEIKFEVRPYYRVEIPGAETGAKDSEEQAETVIAVEAPPAAPPPVDAPAAAVSAITTEVASLIAPPPPPPPAPAPLAPSVLAEPVAADDDGVGNRRGLFGR